jgi:hypothetical protein
LSAPNDNPLRRNPDVAFRELAEGEGGVLLHLVSGSYHGLNDVGALVWELVDGKKTSADIIDAVRQRVEDPPPSLDHDVSSFIAALRERELVI